MAARSFLIAGASTVLLAGAALASPALASTTASSLPSPTVPLATRVAATTAAYNAIEAKIAAGTSLRLRGATVLDATAQSDIIDYGVNGLWQKGIDGSGVTVAYVVTNPDPNIASELASYDALMDLPPANITDITLPSTGAFTCQVECDTGEDELDAEAIHSMAPYANILFVHPAMPETVGIQGWPQIAQAIETIANEHLADVITVSMGDGENDFVNDPTNPGASQQAAIHSLDPAFLDAAAHNIPVTFASGDCGPTAPTVLSDTGQCTPTVGLTADHPADNPWVTAVGGTTPNAGLATVAGRTGPDPLWNTSSTKRPNSDAESAGISTVYAQPSWQQGISALAGVTGRSFPDVVMDASNGTSQASPTFAGILALATQLNGGDLGTINPALYAIGPKGTAAGIVDEPAGYSNSSFGITGYSTGPGFDIASGWGTIYAPDFVPALVAQIDSQQGPSTPSRVAQGDLNQLQASISTSLDKVPSGQTVTITGNGFIPGSSPNGTTIVDGVGVYPYLPGQYGAPAAGPFADPTSTVPGQTWDNVTVSVTGTGHNTTVVPPVVSGPDGNGAVKVTIDTTGMPVGTYTVTITGRLLSQTISFQVKQPQF